MTRRALHVSRLLAARDSLDADQYRALVAVLEARLGHEAERLGRGEAIRLSRGRS